MTATDISIAAERSEIAAWASMMALMPSSVRDALRADCRQVAGGLSISARGLPLVTFNRVIGPGLLGPFDPVALRAHLVSAAAPVVQVQIAPVADVSDAVMTGAGFSPYPVAWAKMARSTAVDPQPDPRIETVTEATAAEFAEVIAAGFGMPPIFAPWLITLVTAPDWRAYLLRRDGRGIAAGALHLGAKDAWLGIAATLPDARGQGAQKELIRHRLAAAATSGRAMAYTETAILDGANPSLQNMRACGFTLAHERRNWVLAG
jgi:GNAT superfamily N-acetyltransferase